jgi:hypothetical protein
MKTNPLLRIRLVALALIGLLAFVAPALAQQSDEGAEPNTSDAAGSGEPTEADIRVAYSAAIERINDGTRERYGDDDAAALLLTLEDINMLGCRGMSRTGVHFDCRVERRMRRADLKPTTDVVQLWVSYEEGSWVVR